MIVATPEVFGSCDGSWSPRYLSEDERVVIADLHRQGLGVRAIAAGLGRSPATISRELRGNRDACSRAVSAVYRAAVRSGLASPAWAGKVVCDAVLR